MPCSAELQTPLIAESLVFDGLLCNMIGKNLPISCKIVGLSLILPLQYSWKIDLTNYRNVILKSLPDEGSRSLEAIHLISTLYDFFPMDLW